ncbi:hypothetical protein FXO38_22552 [Capsicum annuum]|nr:hypothetical protein FXO38_22552 [Capsicum annuum]
MDICWKNTMQFIKLEYIHPTDDQSVVIDGSIATDVPSIATDVPTYDPSVIRTTHIKYNDFVNAVFYRLGIDPSNKILHFIVKFDRYKLVRPKGSEKVVTGTSQRVLNVDPQRIGSELQKSSLVGTKDCISGSIGGVDSGLDGGVSGVGSSVGGIGIGIGGDGGGGSIETSEENKSEEEEDEDKQEEKEVESDKVDDDQYDNNASLIGYELRLKSQHNPFKTISIDRFEVEMQIHNPVELTGNFVVKSQSGNPFNEFKNIMKKEKLEKFFKKSSFGHFLKFPEDNNACLQMSMVYDHHKRSIKLGHLKPSLLSKSRSRITRMRFLIQGSLGCASWIVPTEQELGMTSLITLDFFDTITYPTIELIKKELDGATAIRRAVRQGQPNVDALHDQPAATNLVDASKGVAGGVIDVGGNHVNTYVASICDDNHVDAQENMF